MSTKKYKCPKCTRSFSMPGHLGRHMSAIHGVASAASTKRTPGKGKGKRRGPGRPPGSTSVRRGRAPAVVSRLGLRDMSLDQLGEVIDAARVEARRKIDEMRTIFA